MSVCGYRTRTALNLKRSRLASVCLVQKTAIRPPSLGGAQPTHIGGLGENGPLTNGSSLKVPVTN